MRVKGKVPLISVSVLQMTFNEGKLSELISILRSYMYPKLGILSSITETKVRVVLVVEAAARFVSVVLFVEDVRSFEGCVAGL